MASSGTDTNARDSRSDAEPGNGDDFSKFAREERSGLLAEFWDFLKHNKKWWLLPIVVTLLLLGLVLVLGGTAAAPFIYTLF